MYSEPAMKPLSFMVGAAILLGAIIGSPPAGAIPNQIGGTTFINPAGMRLEDFAALPTTWKNNAELKGPWEMWHDDAVTDTSVELLRLKIPAIVFGVMADEVILQRRDSRIVQFQIVFRPGEKRSSNLSKLNRTLKTNAAAWADTASSEIQLKKGSVTIAIASGDDETVVTIKPATAVAAAF